MVACESFSTNCSLFHHLYPSTTSQRQSVIMLSAFCYLPLFLLSASLGLGGVLETAKESKIHIPVEERGLPILTNPSSLDLFNASASDAATLQVETSTGHYVDIKCDARSYGAGLNARSCFSALQQSPTGDVQEKWAFTRSSQPDVFLPVKLFSGKQISRPKMILTSLSERMCCLDDATCTLKPYLLSTLPSALASAKNVTEAARANIQQCVIRRRIGGTARQIGEVDPRVAAG